VNIIRDSAVGILGRVHPSPDGATRIAILTDIHANLPALTAVLSEVRRLGCGRIYHAGDLIDIGPYPAEVVDLARACDMICVRGNHEAWLMGDAPVGLGKGLRDQAEMEHEQWTLSRLDQAQRDFIRGMPPIVRETIDSVHFSVVHFALAADGRSISDVSPLWSDARILDLFARTPGALICFGHLHERRFNRTYRGRRFLNPGAVGCSPRGEARFATVDIAGGSGSQSTGSHTIAGRCLRPTMRSGCRPATSSARCSSACDAPVQPVAPSLSTTHGPLALQQPLS